MTKSSVQIPGEKVGLKLFGKRFLEIIAVDRGFFRVLKKGNNGGNYRKNIASIVKNNTLRGKIKVNTKGGVIPKRR